MKQKLLTLFLTLTLTVTSAFPGVALAAAGDEISASAAIEASAAPKTISASEKMGALEVTLYGTEQAGALVSRMDSLEDDVYGTITTDPILNRVDNLYDYINGYAGSGEASFLTKLNAVEWQFTESTAGGPAKSRIEALETMLNGEVGAGSLAGRLEALANLAFQDGIVVVETVTLPKDSVIKLEFAEDLSSKTAKAGDVVKYKVADNVFVNDVLVLPKGAEGVGKVTKVVGPRMFGQDARIDVDFGFIYAIDNTRVKVFLGDVAKQAAETVAGAAGAAIGGMVVLGPVGIIGGAFVTGKSVNIPAGSTTFVQVKADTDIQGMVYQGSN